MTILLIGAQGQVGRELCLTLPQHGPVTAWGRRDLDLADLDAIEPRVTAQAPQVIVNAAAYTAVDPAEQDPETAFLLNAAAPERLARAAVTCGATLIHVSTDYVFEGRACRPYPPDAVPHPLSVYGRSKWQGEQAIQRLTQRHIIVRTAWVYGAKGASNFVKTMLRLGAERDTLQVVYDQVGSPTWAYSLAGAIAAIVARLNQCPAGIYHYTNSGVASWYDFAVAIFEEAAALGYPLQVQQVIPITTDQYPTAARRPAYSVLANDKLIAHTGLRPAHWRTALRQMLKEYLQTPPAL